MTANALTLDLPLSACEPPPLPAAIRTRRRTRKATLVPGMRIGVWRIEHELGRGGMATVYAVVHTRFGKRAALKLAHAAVLGPRFTPETFLREARTANLIDHAGIADVFATGTFAGRPYLVMERLSGRSLGAHSAAAPLPRPEAIDILLEICDALGAAHAAGITHRDLKLDNVFLLDSPGADGKRCKLLDWGMARIAGEDDPMRGLIAGTLTYVAPEQARGEAITPAADVYSLAVMAYQLLLGQAPFHAASDVELIHQHLVAQPPAPRSLWAAIPAELEATLCAMLAKQPAERPALDEVARVLRNVRDRLRPRAPRWFEPPAARTPDVLGRPTLPVFASKPQRLLGAALAVAMTAATVLQLISA